MDYSSCLKVAHVDGCEYHGQAVRTIFMLISLKPISRGQDIGICSAAVKTRIMLLIGTGC